MTSEIDQVVRQCHRHWRRRGISRQVATEMGSELSVHLHEAVNDGKSTRDVVGGDVVAFAERWAQAFVSSPSVPGASLPAYAAAAVALLAAIAAGATAYLMVTRKVELITTPSPSDVPGTGSREVVSFWSLPDAARWFWSTIAAGALAMVAAVFLAIGRVVAGAAAAGLAMPVGILAPDAWLISALLAVTLLLVVWRLISVHRSTAGGEG